MRSMTGFGHGESSNHKCKVIAEIKTVNHRYNDINIRIPFELNFLEDRIRKYILKYLIRGRIDIFVSLENYNIKSKKIKVDKDLAMTYHNALRDLSKLLDLPSPNDVYEIAKYQDVMICENDVIDIEMIWLNIEVALRAALKKLLDMRCMEGQNIFEDLSARTDKIDGLVKSIKQYMPNIVDEYRRKLSDKIQELLGESSIDESRIVQETALFAEKINFTEEIVRLESHLQQFNITLSIENEAIGRKMDFIVQEMNRESNTIASKANDFMVINKIIDIKSQLEKIREQIQNIE